MFMIFFLASSCREGYLGCSQIINYTLNPNNESENKLHWGCKLLAWTFFQEENIVYQLFHPFSLFTKKLAKVISALA